MMELFTHGYFGKFDESLEHLATKLALTETWSYSDPEKEEREGNKAAKFKFPILRNYLEHTFRKIKSENKIVISDDTNFSCFNTGLVTQNLEEIFAFFEKNKNSNSRAPYFFKAFIKKSDRDFLNHFSAKYPETANYFDQPEALLFNPRIELIPDIDHIISDNKNRFPSPLNNASEREVRKHLVGALDDISKRVKINYKLAIPQFYDNKFQLLLPLNLMDTSQADLALVVQRINQTTYNAKTCLTIGMAYNNARLIVCPHSEWLKP
ncbi:MAG: DUF3825 domain-containing protein [Bacteroidetes bacterium]|nr:MAG: DUF3825 domain-containing protein [Bacteroidota bacterium]